MKINYQLELDRLTARFEQEGRKPSLLLQSCCGPCSSYVLEAVTPHFQVTVFYYNPNMDTAEEYDRRVAAQKQLLERAGYGDRVALQVADYDHAPFLEAARGLEQEREGGARCTQCFILRLEETARQAAAQGYDYFGTTLTVSPHKDAPRINQIGQALGEKYGVAWLPSDFKKKEGFKRSTILSKEYDLYRQDYCGCEFSKGHLQQSADTEGRASNTK